MDCTFTSIHEKEFRKFCEKMFETNNNDEIRRIFAQFDASTNDNQLTGKEFTTFQKWTQILTRPKPALIIVDVQNDFIDGTLSIIKGSAGQDPREVVPVINNLLTKLGDKFDLIVYTLDWHPENHISFIDNVRTRKLDPKFDLAKVKLFDVVRFVEPVCVEQKLWPKHCVQNTPGAEVHPDLKQVETGERVYKGQNSDVDSYSAFFDNKKVNETRLNSLLKSHHITDVYVCGLAYDVCVGDTCYDALELGYKTVLLKNCSRGLDVNSMAEVDRNIRRRNGLVINGDVETVDKFLTAEQIPWCWAKFVANCLTKF